MKKTLFLRCRALAAALLALVFICAPALAKEQTITLSAADFAVDQDGFYSSMEEVAVYLATYGKLPENFLTKKQAEALGWDNRAGNLDEVAPGCSIGGDYFGNYEGNVPKKSGRKWTECDINFGGGYRGGERIVFSNDGLIYYSNDHYNTFTQVVVELSQAESTGNTAGSQEKNAEETPATASLKAVKIKKNGEYTSMEEVAAYLHQYHQLPGNYLTKSQAKALGFTNKKDNLNAVAPGCALGGDSFGNREGLLPDQQGRQWYECDVNTVNGKRGKQRLVYSNDGLIYFSDDNHKSFTQLYQ